MMNQEAPESSTSSPVTTGTISTVPTPVSSATIPSDNIQKLYVNVDGGNIVSLGNFSSNSVVTSIQTVTNTGRITTLPSQVRFPGPLFIHRNQSTISNNAANNNSNNTNNNNTNVAGNAGNAVSAASSAHPNSSGDTVTFSIPSSTILNSKQFVEQRNKLSANSVGNVVVTSINPSSGVGAGSGTVSNSGPNSTVQRGPIKKGVYKLINLPLSKNVSVSNTGGSVSNDPTRIIVRTPFTTKNTPGNVNSNTGSATGAVKTEKVHLQRFPNLQGNQILSLNTLGLTQISGQLFSTNTVQQSGDNQGQQITGQSPASQQVHVVQAQVVPQSQSQQITAAVLTSSQQQQQSQQQSQVPGQQQQQHTIQARQVQHVQQQQVQQQAQQHTLQQSQRQTPTQITRQIPGQATGQINVTQLTTQAQTQLQNPGTIQKKKPAFEVRQTPATIQKQAGIKRNYSRTASVGSATVTTSPATESPNQPKRIKRNSTSSAGTPRAPLTKTRKTIVQTTPTSQQGTGIHTLQDMSQAQQQQQQQQQSQQQQQQQQQQHHIKFQPQSQVLQAQVIQQLQQPIQQIQHPNQASHQHPSTGSNQEQNQMMPHILLNTSTSSSTNESFQNTGQQGSGQQTATVMQSNVAANSILISQLLNKIPQVSGTADCKNGVITLGTGQTLTSQNTQGNLTTIAPTFLVQMNPSTVSSASNNTAQVSGVVPAGVSMSQNFVKKPQMLVKVPQKLDRKRAQKDGQNQPGMVGQTPGKNFAMFNVSQGKPAAFSIQSTKSSVPVKSQEEMISEQIKILDNSIKVSLTQQKVVQTLHSTTPPVWWLIFNKYATDRCAPLSAFRNFPLAKEFCEYVNTNVCFEIQLLDEGCSEQNNYFAPINGTLQNGGNFAGNDLHGMLDGLGSAGNAGAAGKTGEKTASPHKTDCDGPAYWFVKIVDNCGIYFKLRYVGFDNNSRFDFWINLRTRNLYPIGYARSNCYKMRLPKEIEEFAHDTYRDALKTMIETCRNTRTDLLTRFTEQIQLPWIKVGLKLEAQDKKRNFRPATIDNLIGDRIHVRFDNTHNPATKSTSSANLTNNNNNNVSANQEESEKDLGLWAHLQGGKLRPVGWAQLVGHQLLASVIYAKKSLDRAFSNIRQLWKNDNFDISDWGLFTRFEKFDDTNSFREGFKLEVINPFNQLSICPATVLKVLRFNFLLLTLDSFQNENCDPGLIFITHASSPYILPIGFASTYNIHLQPPPGYNHKFDWTEYCYYTESTPAPINLFVSLDYSDNMFNEGMLLEAVDSLEPNLICNAVIKRVVGHLLLIHYIGWEDSMDQWVDFRSPNLFPVGYCDLIQYPLQGPPDRVNNSTPKKESNKRSNSCKKTRKDSFNQDDNGQQGLQQPSSASTATASSSGATTPMSLTEEKKNLTLIDLLSSAKDITDHYPIANSSELIIRFNSDDLQNDENIEKRLKTLEQFNFTANMSIMSDVEESKNQENICFNSLEDLTNNKENVKTLSLYLEKDKKIELGRIKNYSNWKFEKTNRDSKDLNGFISDSIDGSLEPFDIFSIQDENASNLNLRFNNFSVETPNFKSLDSSLLNDIISPEYTLCENLDINKASSWTEQEVAAYLKKNVTNNFYLQNILDLKINGNRLLSLTKSGALKITKGVLSEAMRLLYHCDRLKIRLNQVKS